MGLAVLSNINLIDYYRLVIGEKQLPSHFYSSRATFLT